MFFFTKGVLGQPSPTGNLIACFYREALDPFLRVWCLIRYSTPGGYSSKAVHPIALAKVMSIAQMMKKEFPNQDLSLSGIGGVETGGDAAEFILLGANTVQVCLICFTKIIY